MMEVFALEFQRGDLDLKYENNDQLKHFLENLLETFDKMKAHKANKAPGSYEIRVPHSMKHISSAHIYITMVDVEGAYVPCYAICVRYLDSMSTGSYIRTDKEQDYVYNMLRGLLISL